ncbi:hypothetical protein HDU83_006231 [Entophlyctis luteolus]|nr:hypothetical protein HDU83_006231 [Entophlyctis luteolus]
MCRPGYSPVGGAVMGAAEAKEDDSRFKEVAVVLPAVARLFLLGDVGAEMLLLMPASGAPVWRVDGGGAVRKVCPAGDVDVDAAAELEFAVGGDKTDDENDDANKGAGGAREMEEEIGAR